MRLETCLVKHFSQVFFADSNDPPINLLGTFYMQKSFPIITSPESERSKRLKVSNGLTIVVVGCLLSKEILKNYIKDSFAEMSFRLAKLEELLGG